MNLSKKLPTLAFATFMLTLSPSHAQVSLDSSSQSINILLEELRELTRIPAFSVAIVQNGKLVAQSVVGEVNTNIHTAARPEHLFRLASVSKVIGSTMLAVLVQEGVLDSHAPISNYLPDLPTQFRNLTAVQLLSHTSGMPHYQPIDVLRGGTHYNTAAEALATVGNRALLDKPGESYSYSTHGYTLLSALYEAIAEVPLRQAIDEFRSKLTGLSSPVLEDITRRNNLRSNLYEIEEGDIDLLKPLDQTRSPFGSGFIASASDLAFFGDAVLHSENITDETREMMFKPILLNDGSNAGPSYYDGIGFAWRTEKDESGRRVAHHAGVTPGARSALLLYPDHGLSVAFLSNSRWTASMHRMGYALGNIVLEGQSPTSISGSFDFSGTFRNEPISGQLNCSSENDLCQFTDNAGPLSAWLTGYNYMDSDLDSWSAKVFRFGESYVVKLIGATGLFELRLDTDTCMDQCYSANIGRGGLHIRFSEPFFDGQ